MQTAGAQNMPKELGNEIGRVLVWFVGQSSFPLRMSAPWSVCLTRQHGETFFFFLTHGVPLEAGSSDEISVKRPAC